MKKEEFCSKLKNFLNIVEEYRKEAPWYEWHTIDSLINQIKTSKVFLECKE
jgi:hypothetical protein